MFSILFLWLGIFSCQPQSSVCDSFSLTLKADYQFPYDLQVADDDFTLPPNLSEISGIAILPKSDKIAAIQDEQGVVFLLNKKTGAIDKEITFRDPGDYEDIAVVGKDIFVLKSNGTIYKINDFEADNQQVTKIETELKKEADAEGLCFDAKNNRLLVACKGKVSADTAYLRGVFAFDLKNQTLSTSPVLTINIQSINAYLQSGEKVKYHEQIMGCFKEGKEGFAFAPSGIAVHPVSGEYYVISSVGKLLMVLDPSGQIIHIEKLKKSIHPQPEGICFEADGTLWISNEGKEGEPAKLSRFGMKK